MLIDDCSKVYQILNSKHHTIWSNDIDEMILAKYLFINYFIKMNDIFILIMNHNDISVQHLDVFCTLSAPFDESRKPHIDYLPPLPGKMIDL